MVHKFDEQSYTHDKTGAMYESTFPCVICDMPYATNINIGKQQIPVCEECYRSYGKSILYIVFLGFYKLAESKVLEKQGLKKEAAKSYKRSGKYLGKDPVLTARLTARNFKFKAEIIKRKLK